MVDWIEVGRTGRRISGLAFGCAFAFDIMQIYAFRMAAVFMVTASTLAIRTAITPRWMAIAGYAAAAFLLLCSSVSDWTLFVFPTWMLLLSIYILRDNLRGSNGSGWR